jgi:hypothetical protein
MKGDVLRREADQHDRNASVILSGVAPSRDDLQCAIRETEHANDKRGPRGRPRFRRRRIRDVRRS